MEIKLNSQVKTVAQKCCVQDLLDSTLSGKQNGIAVAVNSLVIPKGEWAEHFLRENDEVLIIRATQGG